MSRPAFGSMVYWRFRDKKIWHFGYVTAVQGYNLVRMGTYNGDNMGGTIVDINEIEWRQRV